MLTHIIRSVVLVGFVVSFCAAPLSVAAQADWDEHTKQLVGQRLARAAAARDAARDVKAPSADRVQALVQLLHEELAHPVADNSRSLPAYTYAEQIQCQILSALRETGDWQSITEALAVVPHTSPAGKRLAIAAGFTIGPGAEAGVVRRVCQALSGLILNDPDDFIRSKAAEALGDAACAYPALRAEAAKVLAAALRDPGYRMVQHHSGLPEPQRLNYVYLDAKGGLKRLGYEVVGFEVRDKRAGAMAPAARAGDDRGSLAAREVLAGNGYTVTWNAERQELRATRGARTILLRADSDKAAVDGRPQKMDAPARLVDGRLQIPGSFMAPAVAIR